ncbi:ABC transporter permease [Agrococcus carbonis]|uniref:ABC-type nitrate/sulfonate/bicarbonate transport system, permease component n=1 Tax=Agrococcus carbonis TaxID=684552 RepID=A0A1H1NG47_9MICO|nr:ABC transporter permease [Agrococcus carbonis]SDR97966.1 ABC-type nitrate/sulfonate/bicarbonate transport system, permease component [Agrococcus carbonis]
MTAVRTRSADASAPVAAPRAPKPLLERTGFRIALRWIVLVVLLVAWQVATMLMPSPFFPQPVRIFERAFELWLPNETGFLNENVTTDVLPSLGRMLAGFGVSVVAGVVLGVAIGLSRRIGDYIDPIVQFMRAVPPPALIPVFLVLFGTGDSMRILLIAFGTVWPILLNTIEGVRGIEALKYETATVFRIRFTDRLARIVLPGAAPKIFAGVRTSLAIALILMVISEMVAASNGIGFGIVQAQRGFAFLDMWAGIALLGVLGFVLNLLLTVVERRVLRWQRTGGRETV